MIRLNRLPEPSILAENKKKWLDSYLKKREKGSKERPKNQYNHPDVLETLRSMSFNKCFYCERLLDEIIPEVDHYLEVSSHPELIFEWTNLYLACPECNLKIRTIPISDCIDPCQEDPSEYLKFSQEFIGSETEKGLKTIQKYKLSRSTLTSERGRALREFDRVLHELQLYQQRTGMLTPAQKELILSFAWSTRPFSLMFKALLETNPTTLDILGSD